MNRIAAIALAGTLAATLGMAGTASARDGRPAGPGPHAIDIATLDTDGDGTVSRAELTAAGTARLAAADTNGNGRLDRSELIAALPQRPALMDIFGPDRAAMMADRMIARYGTGEAADFAIEAMIARHVGDIFARLDADNSGTITAAEIEAGKGRHASRSDGHGKRGHGWRRD